MTSPETSAACPVPTKAEIWRPTRPVEHIATLLARRSRADQVRLLVDTRPLHRLLARLSIERQTFGPAGRYRRLDEEVSVIARINGRAPMISRTSSAANVSREMDRLAVQVERILWDPPAENRRRSVLIALMAQFFLIHPYTDGNGRIARIFVQRAAALLDLPLNASWTLETANYGPAFFISLDMSGRTMKLLEAYMARFFD